MADWILIYEWGGWPAVVGIVLLLVAICLATGYCVYRQGRRAPGEPAMEEGASALEVNMRDVAEALAGFSECVASIEQPLREALAAGRIGVPPETYRWPRTRRLLARLGLACGHGCLRCLMCDWTFGPCERWWRWRWVREQAQRLAGVLATLLRSKRASRAASSVDQQGER